MNYALSHTQNDKSKWPKDYCLSRCLSTVKITSQDYIFVSVVRIPKRQLNNSISRPQYRTWRLQESMITTDRSIANWQEFTPLQN